MDDDDVCLLGVDADRTRLISDHPLNPLVLLSRYFVLHGFLRSCPEPSNRPSRLGHTATPSPNEGITPADVRRLQGARYGQTGLVLSVPSLSKP